MSNTPSRFSGVALTGFLVGVVIGLKLKGYIDWSWWTIAATFVVGCGMYASILLIVVMWQFKTTQRAFEESVSKIVKHFEARAES